MLDFMRRHAQSWMIKVALGAVAVVFVFWGIWSPNEGLDRDLVQVGSQTITIAEARNYYQNLRERYQSIYGEKFNDEAARKLGLKERAVKDLVQKTLLLQEARRLGLKVSPEEVQASIQSYPAFQRDGFFDKATYLQALQRARIQAKEFEAGQQQMLLVAKMQALIVSSAKVSDRELLDRYRESFEKVNLEFLAVSPADVKGVSVPPEEVKEFFSKHREDFKTPARVKIRYLLFDPKEYAKQVQASPKEIEDYYQNNREKFGEPKKAKIRHILIKADAKDAEAAAKAKTKAESIREEAVKGKDFAQLAKQHSEDPATKNAGGELGYISKGQVIPDIEEAVFALKAGGISAVVQTPYGYHILKVDEILEARTEPLEKVKGRVEALIRDRKAKEVAQDEADQAYAAGSKAKGLDAFAAEKKLTLRDTPLFAAGDKITLDAKIKDAAFVLSKNEISPVLRVGESFVVLQVTEKQEPRIPDLKEAEGRVSEVLRQQKEKEKALAKGKEALEKLRKGENSKSLAAREGWKVEETGFFERAADPPKMPSSEDLRKAVSTLSRKTPYPEAPLFADGKYYLLHLKEVKDIDAAQFESQKENFRRALLQQKQEAILTGWLDTLLDQAKASGKYKVLKEANEAL